MGRRGYPASCFPPCLCACFGAPRPCGLTAHVNFESLRNIALSAGLACPEVVTQGHFLTQLGIEHRINTLIHNINDDILKENVLSGAKRLLDPQKMGILFKALACTAAPMAIPGFNMHSSGAPLT
jgi:NADH dehydrogenase [ubiquinone] 1 alpha subcomplex assembly factor 7